MTILKAMNPFARGGVGGLVFSDADGSVCGRDMSPSLAAPVNFLRPRGITRPSVSVE